MNIYDIGAKLAAIMREIEDNGGEVTEDIEERLNSLYENETQKFNAYFAARAELKLLIEGAKTEESRLKALRMTREKALARLESRLFDYLKASGERDKETELGKCWIQAGGDGTIEIRDEDDFNDWVKKVSAEDTDIAGKLAGVIIEVPATFKVDRVELKKLVKGGMEIEGVTLHPAKEGLRFK